MTEKKLYTCDICHTDFASKQNAVACEKAHRTITEIKDARFRAKENFPDKILVKFNDCDNSEIWYVRGSKKIN